MTPIRRKEVFQFVSLWHHRHKETIINSNCCAMGNSEEWMVSESSPFFYWTILCTFDIVLLIHPDEGLLGWGGVLRISPLMWCHQRRMSELSCLEGISTLVDTLIQGDLKHDTTYLLYHLGVRYSMYGIYLNILWYTAHVHYQYQCRAFILSFLLMKRGPH